MTFMFDFSILDFERCSILFKTIGGTWLNIFGLGEDLLIYLILSKVKEGILHFGAMIANIIILRLSQI